MAVVRLGAAVDDTIQFHSDVIPPQVQHSDIVEANRVRGLADGHHRMRWGIRAWFFDMNEIRKTYGYSSPVDLWASQLAGTEAGAPWSPFDVWTDSPTRYRYGPSKKPWREYWPDLRSRVRPVEVESLGLASKDFQVVDRLPLGYPVVIQSTEVDSTVRANFRMRLFYCPRDTAIGCWWTLARDTPVPIAGIVHFRLSRGRLSAADIFPVFADWPRSKGFFALDKLVVESRGIRDRTTFMDVLAGDTRGEKVRFNMVLEPSRMVALNAATDSYWGGTIQLEGPIMILESCGIDSTLEQKLLR
jgi:hypothetical protein